MTPRRIILGLTVLTAAVFCLVAAVKLRATPRYDRIRVGMDYAQVEQALAPPGLDSADGRKASWSGDEGVIVLEFGLIREERSCPIIGPLLEKQITSRGPLERLAWLAGWRPSIPAPTSPAPTTGIPVP